MTNTHKLIVEIEVDVKDEDALRAATGLELRPGGQEEPATWTDSMTPEEQLKIFVGTKIAHDLQARTDVFSDVRVSTDR